jgi:hypothetical protein
MQKPQECICKDCETFKGSDLTGGLFCAKGQANKKVKKVSCSCPKCPLYNEYELKGQYFCKAELEKMKKLVGAYLLIALFALVAIAASVYFMKLTSVLLKTIIYVGVAGGIGGVFYCIRGFIFHTSQDDFDPSWKWWYIYNPVTGFVIGVLTYFLIVGGLLTLGSFPQADYSKGILLYCSISFLAGFAFKKFNSKLDELASTIFSSGEEPTPTNQTKTKKQAGA